MWSSIKNEFNNVHEQNGWLNVSFWNDNWRGASLASTFNLPDFISQHLHASIADFILDGHYRIPQIVQTNFPGIISLVQQVNIPIGEIEDKMIWKHTDNGVLTFKDAYTFKALLAKMHIGAKCYGTKISLLQNLFYVGDSCTIELLLMTILDQEAAP